MKNIIKLLVVMFLLVGCSSNKLKTEPSKDENALSNKYDYVIGEYLIDGEMIQYGTLNRNDEIIITEEDDNYYYAIANDITIAVDKKYVRTENESPFIEFSGYTKKDSKVYSDLGLNEEIKSFSLNDKVKVLDYIDGVILVDVDGKTGYMNPDNVSETEIKTYVAPKPSVAQVPVVEYGSSSNDDYQPSSGGSGSDGGNDSGTSQPEPEVDTSGDLNFEELFDNVYRYSVTLVANKNYVKGIILMDGTPSYISVTKRGLEAHVIEENESCYYVLIDGRIGKVNKTFVRLDSEEKYEEWQGYTYSNTKVYSDFNMTEVINSYKTNEKLKIVDKISDVFVVELEDGSFGYMHDDDISEDEIKVYVAPKPTTTTTPSANYSDSSNDNYQPSSGGGNDSGGGSDAGGGGDSGGSGDSGGGDSGGGSDEPISDYSDDHL